jgi:hypothetical protein
MRWSWLKEGLKRWESEGGASQGALGQRRPLIRPEGLRGRRTKRRAWSEEGCPSRVKDGLRPRLDLNEPQDHVRGYALGGNGGQDVHSLGSSGWQKK